MRLHIGCNKKKLDGFLNVDIYPHECVDIVMDASKMGYEDGSIEEIYSSHMLEHVPHTKAVGTLTEWNRVLARGGNLYLSVPDFDSIVQIYLKYGFMTQWIMNILYGDQNGEYEFHYVTYTYPVLCSFLNKAGFRQIKRIKRMPYRLLDCSNLIEGTTKMGVSLNIEAVK